MIKTEDDARRTECAVDRSTNCVATDCMGWRWFDEEPDELSLREEHYFPEKADGSGLSERAFNTAAKKSVVTEPKRPASVGKLWKWTPTQKDPKGDWDFGYWTEDEGSFLNRQYEIEAARRGYCGRAGKI